MDSSEDDISRRLLQIRRADSLMYRANTTKPFLKILLCFILHFFSYALMIPLMTFYAIDVISEDRGYNISSNEPCTNATKDEQNLQKELADLFAPLNFIWFFPGLIPTLFLGPLIDRLGRKIGLILPMTGTLIKQVIYLIVILGRYPLWILFIGNGIEGVTGGFAAMLMAGFGMVADITLPGKERTMRISIVEATQAIASSVAIFAVGYGIVYIKYVHCVSVALMLNIINILYTSTAVPETLQVRVHTDRPVITTLKNISKCFVFYVKKTEDKRRVKLILGIFAFILTVAVNFSKPGIMNLYLVKQPLCWGEVKINIVTSVQIIGNWIVILIFMKLVQKLLSLEDRIIGIFGCISSITACVIMAYANTDLLVYLVVVSSVFMRVTIPMIRSIMSRSVRQDEQGALYAGMGCIEMICAALIGMLSMYLYKDTLTSYPSDVFIVMAVLMVVVLGIFIVLNMLIMKRGPSLPGYTRLDGRESDRRVVN